MARLILSVGTPFVPSRRYCYVLLLSEWPSLPSPLVIFFESTDSHCPYLCPSSVIKASIDVLDGFVWYFSYWWMANEFGSIDRLSQVKGWGPFMKELSEIFLQCCTLRPSDTNTYPLVKSTAANLVTVKSPLVFRPLFPLN